jgi:hypothetical protein
LRFNPEAVKEAPKTKWCRGAAEQGHIQAQRLRLWR